jgi:FdhD protein
MIKSSEANAPLIVPNPADSRLTERETGTDQTGAEAEINVPVERPLTLYLNSQEIVTMMTIGDYPEYLALGYLLNQNMLKYDDAVTDVEYDDDLQVVVVRTEHHTSFEEKLKKRTQTSGCAQGTVFGDLLEAVENAALPKADLRTSWLYEMIHAINIMPSLYLEAGAIHGYVLCKQGTPVCYTGDVGRHNAVDKIAGWMYRYSVDPANKILYATGRLTSEMIIKTVRMGIPILVSRSGFTAWGGRSGSAGRPDADRPRARKALRGVVGPGPHHVRPEPGVCRRRVDAQQTQAATMNDHLNIPGVLLAGGLARRMGGGDKTMREIGGQTILARAIARLRSQCDELILNANGDPGRFAAFGLQVLRTVSPTISDSRTVGWHSGRA